MAQGNPCIGYARGSPSAAQPREGSGVERQARRRSLPAGQAAEPQVIGGRADYPEPIYSRLQGLLARQAAELQDGGDRVGAPLQGSLPCSSRAFRQPDHQFDCV